MLGVGFGATAHLQHLQGSEAGISQWKIKDLFSSHHRAQAHVPTALVIITDPFLPHHGWAGRGYEEDYPYRYPQTALPGHQHTINWVWLAKSQPGQRHPSIPRLRPKHGRSRQKAERTHCIALETASSRLACFLSGFLGPGAGNQSLGKRNPLAKGKFSNQPSPEANPASTGSGMETPHHPGCCSQH